MNDQTAERINKEIYKKYPRFKDCKPEIHALSNGNYALIYTTSSQTEDGFSMPLTLRVSVNGCGEIIKISTSK